MTAILVVSSLLRDPPLIPYSGIAQARHTTATSPIKKLFIAGLLFINHPGFSPAPADQFKNQGAHFLFFLEPKRPEQPKIYHHG